jgi:hypothetical protein
MTFAPAIMFLNISANFLKIFFKLIEILEVLRKFAHIAALII